MKIRNGFVSNSSSSSFVILGTEFPSTETQERFNALTSKEDIKQAFALYSNDNGYAISVKPGHAPVDPDGEEDDELELVAMGILLMEEEGGCTKDMSYGEISEHYQFLENKLAIRHQDVKLICRTLER